MIDFWNKFELLCSYKNESPNMVAKNIGISSGSITSWKNGRIPNGDTLADIANYFNVSVEYLLTEDEISIRPSMKSKDFSSLSSLPQRWASLRHGRELDDEVLNHLSEFTNSKLSFLCSNGQSEYCPKDESVHISINDLPMLEKILGIMDRCSDSEDLKGIQIQLSHIVRYWLSKKNYGYDELYSADLHSVSKDKLNFLYGRNEQNTDQAFRYGFNFSELDEIREVTGLSFLYMFTGTEFEDLKVS